MKQHERITYLKIEQQKLSEEFEKWPGFYSKEQIIKMHLSIKKELKKWETNVKK